MSMSRIEKRILGENVSTIVKLLKKPTVIKCRSSIPLVYKYKHERNRSRSYADSLKTQATGLKIIYIAS
jgi:hypothetical protein